MHGLSDHGIEEYLADVRSACVMVILPEEPLPTILTTDPKDDPILATAIAGQAAVLCSLDRHLHQPEAVAYCRAHGIDITTDVELMRRLREGGEQVTNG